METQKHDAQTPDSSKSLVTSQVDPEIHKMQNLYRHVHNGPIRMKGQQGCANRRARRHDNKPATHTHIIYAFSLANSTKYTKHTHITHQ